MSALAQEAGSTADAVLQHIQTRLGAAKSRDAQAFATHLLRRVAPEDVAARSAESWAALALGLLDFLRVRPVAAAHVRVFNPNVADHGWESPYTVIQIVTDDMPFLVDSVGIAIAQGGLLLHSVIHPVYSVKRDPGGHVLQIDAEGSGGGKPESVMHFEIDRISEPGELLRMEQAVHQALQDVAHCFNDWRAMRDKMLAVAEDMATQKLPLSPEGLAEAQEFLRWVADDHFTFLGYREYRVTRVGDEDVLLAVEDSGLGILRGSERSVAPRSLKSLVARDLPQSGSIDAIILTKTNARATVHRPGHMDYIGVLEFDSSGVPTVEHRFLGLYASGAYTRRPWDIPLVRQKYEAVMVRSGLRRDS